MSRDYTPKYRVEYETNIGRYQMAWKDVYGRPDKDGLENWRKVYNASFQPGEINGPLTPNGIVQHISNAKLIRQSTNEIVAEAHAPVFEII